MRKKKKDVDYSELIARAAAEDQAELGDGVAAVPEESGVDYGTEYRKQTGRDLETGEIAVQ